MPAVVIAHTTQLQEATLSTETLIPRRSFLKRFGAIGAGITIADADTVVIKGNIVGAQTGGTSALVNSGAAIDVTASAQGKITSLTIGDVSRALAGTYQDNLILTVTSN